MRLTIRLILLSAPLLLLPGCLIMMVPMMGVMMAGDMMPMEKARDSGGAPEKKGHPEKSPGAAPLPTVGNPADAPAAAGAAENGTGTDRRDRS